MYNQEENEVAVKTVASNKISKERGKTMENEKTSLNIRKLKKQVKGITLIALVVTIIGLLILAGIALNLTIGQNGIFSRAQTAANTWRNAESNEQLVMGELEDWMDGYLGGENSQEEVEEGTLSWMYEKAVADGCDGTSCTEPENHLHIGDYVDFKLKTGNLSKSIDVSIEETGYGEAQHYTVNSSTNQLNWRVLGYDTNTKQVKLIAGTPLKADGNDGYLVMRNAESYVNGINRLDSICAEIYEGIDGVVRARSVKIEDINELLEVEETEIRDINLNPVLNGARNYGDSIRDIEGWTPESFLNVLKKYGVNSTVELNELENTNPDHEVFTALESGEGISNLTGTVTGYIYAVNGAPSEGAPYVSANEKAYELIFNGEEYGTGGAYWLSSPGVRAYSDFANFGPGVVTVGGSLGRVYSGGNMFNSNGFGYDLGYGVRPVVSLNLGVREIDVPKLDEAPTEPEW